MKHFSQELPPEHFVLETADPGKFRCSFFQWQGGLNFYKISQKEKKTLQKQDLPPASALATVSMQTFPMVNSFSKHCVTSGRTQFSKERMFLIKISKVWFCQNWAHIRQHNVYYFITYKGMIKFKPPKPIYGTKLNVY